MESVNLATLCFEHLEVEEALLDASLKAVQDVRAALLAGQFDHLTEALRGHDHLAEKSEAMQRRRDEFQRKAAAQLGLAAVEVNVTNLARRLPADASQELTLRRQRMSNLAAEVDRLNRANWGLIRPNLEFFEQLFAEAGGGAAASVRYGPRGRFQQATRDCLVQARG